MKLFLPTRMLLALVSVSVTQTFYAQEPTDPSKLSTTLIIPEAPKTSETASSIPSPVTQTPAVSNIVEKPAPYFASTIANTLTTIFNVLATLVQNTSSQQTTHSSLSTLLESVFNLVAQTSDKKGVELDLFIADLKKKCGQSLNNTLEELSINDTLDDDDYKRPSKNDEKEAKAQAALCNVATIVTGVANIVQDPHDKVNVGQSVGSILAGIINIALLASHKPRQQTLQYLTEALNV